MFSSCGVLADRGVVVPVFWKILIIFLILDVIRITIKTGTKEVPNMISI
jgi:hypothetical protein